MEELLKLVQLVRQEAPQARVKVDNLMVTHYFTMEELLNICNKYAEYKYALADVVGQSEQLPCGDLMKHNFSLSKIGRCITCDRAKEKAR